MRTQHVKFARLSLALVLSTFSGLYLCGCSNKDKPVLDDLQKQLGQKVESVVDCRSQIAACQKVLHIIPDAPAAPKGAQQPPRTTITHLLAMIDGKLQTLPQGQPEKDQFKAVALALSELPSPLNGVVYACNQGIEGRPAPNANEMRALLLVRASQAKVADYIMNRVQALDAEVYDTVGRPDGGWQYLQVNFQKFVRAATGSETAPP
jgi:hypothetical protein